MRWASSLPGSSSTSGATGGDTRSRHRASTRFSTSFSRPAVSPVRTSLGNPCASLSSFAPQTTVPPPRFCRSLAKAVSVATTSSISPTFSFHSVCSLSRRASSARSTREVTKAPPASRDPSLQMERPRGAIRGDGRNRSKATATQPARNVHCARGQGTRVPICQQEHSPLRVIDLPVRGTDLLVRGRRVSVRGRRVSVRGRRVSVRGRRVSVRGRRVSVRGRRVSVRGRRVSVRGRRVSVRGRRVSVRPGRFPLRGTDPSVRPGRLPRSSHRPPRSTRTLPSSRDRPPSTRETLPSNRATPPPSSQTLPSSSNAIPSATHSMPSARVHLDASVDVLDAGDACAGPPRELHGFWSSGQPSERQRPRTPACVRRG